MGTICEFDLCLRRHYQPEMKFNKLVSSSRRKQHKRYHNAPSHIRRKLMSSALSKELRQKHGVRSLPVRKDDEVQVVRGHHKGNHIGKVVEVYRKKYVLHIDRIQKEKANGAQVYVGIHPSNVVIMKLKLDNSRRRMLDHRARSKAGQEKDAKGKHTEATVASA